MNHRNEFVTEIEKRNPIHMPKLDHDSVPLMPEEIARQIRSWCVLILCRAEYSIPSGYSQVCPRLGVRLVMADIGSHSEWSCLNGGIVGEKHSRCYPWGDSGQISVYAGTPGDSYRGYAETLLRDDGVITRHLDEIEARINERFESINNL